MLSGRCGSGRSRANRTKHVWGNALAGGFQLAFDSFTKPVALVWKQSILNLLRAALPIICFLFCEQTNLIFP